MQRGPETRHIPFICPGNHEDWNACQFCEGGLSACAVCGAFEGATTTHCPGSRIHDSFWDVVYAGKLDYRFGRWIDHPSRFSPAWWTKHGTRVHALVTRFQGRMDQFGIVN